MRLSLKINFFFDILSVQVCHLTLDFDILLAGRDLTINIGRLTDFLVFN